jgi:hypothetical protein
MKFLPLMWAGIWRKPARAILTLLSVVNAFLLFGILQGFASGLDHAVAETHADMLLSFSRISQIEPLPVAEADQIKLVPGCARSPRCWRFPRPISRACNSSPPRRSTRPKSPPPHPTSTFPRV